MRGLNCFALAIALVPVASHAVQNMNSASNGKDMNDKSKRCLQDEIRGKPDTQSKASGTNEMMREERNAR